VTRYDRTEAELQEWWLFSTVAAGKTAVTQARLLDRFLNLLPTAPTPFEQIALAITMENEGLFSFEGALRESRLGQYTRLSKCFRQSIGLDLTTCTVKDLEAIHGVGPKTARMFLMHSRPNQRFAALDVHILKYLRVNGHPEAPLVTPSGAKHYALYEAAFLVLADASGRSVSEFDLDIWRSYTRARRA
jgi:hypothetical protein